MFNRPGAKKAPPTQLLQCIRCAAKPACRQAMRHTLMCTCALAKWGKAVAILCGRQDRRRCAVEVASHLSRATGLILLTKGFESRSGDGQGGSIAFVILSPSPFATAFAQWDQAAIPACALVSLEARFQLSVRRPTRRGCRSAGCHWGWLRSSTGRIDRSAS